MQKQTNSNKKIQEFYFAQKAFIESDGKILLVQKSLADPNQPGKWEVPGGRMEFGEDVDEHIKREIREEVALEITPHQPFHIWQWQINRLNHEGYIKEIQIVAVARICSIIDGTVNLDGNVSEDYLTTYRWVKPEHLLSYDLIENMIPVVKAYLHTILH